MRIAVISDIHGNLEALTKALRLIETRHIDRIVCLGDTVGYGPNPNECLDRVRDVAFASLLGNHDAAALDLSITRHFNVYARDAAAWTARVLSPENQEYLKTLPLSLEDNGVTFVHATPKNPGEWHYIFSQAEADLNFSSFETPVCFVGHSHTPQIFSRNRSRGPVRRDDRNIINVGSVGQPRDGDPSLAFGIFDTDTWTYEQVRAPYDIAAVAEKIIRAGLPRYLADRLFYGQ
ncbi:MAG: metallophosphoesterase [Ignavibacteriales bacterium CG07_land_8_20_14_0_80_59_12]|nr:MAG: metallophosphoesterase [Ignavibacteriales bacterium CG07_land_8_20_14_0_80_59_12]